MKFIEIPYFLEKVKVAKKVWHKLKKSMNEDFKVE